MEVIGEKLKSSREEKGLSLEEVSEDLKIEIKDLKNIESGNRKAFDDVFVVKQYIYEYAKYLGLDYEKLVEEYQNANLNCPTIIDWRSDVSNMFKQTLYTEDDAAVIAKYEATTSEIQSQDKQLELRLKQIESEHKAVQTEMESVKKVIDKNIDDSFKSFA